MTRVINQNAYCYENPYSNCLNRYLNEQNMSISTFSLLFFAPSMRILTQSMWILTPNGREQKSSRGHCGEVLQQIYFKYLQLLLEK